jgi:hypothetical protein
MHLGLVMKIKDMQFSRSFGLLIYFNLPPEVFKINYFIVVKHTKTILIITKFYLYKFGYSNISLDSEKYKSKVFVKMAGS